MLRAVLFDLNGVLLDDEPLHLELFCALAAEEGVSLAAEAYLARYAGIDDRTAFARLFLDHGRTLPDDALRRLCAEKSRRYRAAVEGRELFFPGAVALVREAARRVPVGVVTSAPREEAMAALKRGGIFDRLTALVCREDVGRPKPDPEPYVAGLERLNRDLRRLGKEPVPPRGTLAVEDTEAGIAAARGAGLKVVALGHTQPRGRLEAADAFVARIVDLELDAVEQEIF